MLLANKDKDHMTSNNYCHAYSCNLTPSVDDIFTRFSEDRQLVLQSIQNPGVGTRSESVIVCPIPRPIPLLSHGVDIKNWLSVDRSCRFGMGQTMTGHTLNKKFMCPQCYNINRLVDLTRKFYDEPFYIECGKYAGKYLIIKKIPNPRLNIKSFPGDDFHAILGLINQKTQGCSFVDSDNMMMVSGDQFTNQILCNWYLQSVVDSLGYPHILDLYTAFICQDSGYLLFSYPTYSNVGELFSSEELFPISSQIGSSNGQIPSHYESLIIDHSQLSDTAVSLVTGIISQLVVILRVLMPYQFTHGSPSANDIVFDNEPVAYIYDGVHIKCPITLKLTNFSKSSVTFHNQSGSGPKIRLHPETPVGKFLLGIQTFHPEIQIHPQDSSFYCLSSDTYRSVKYLRSEGIPVFGSSFDFYSMFLGLMFNSNFRSIVFTNENLRAIWESLWLPDDIPEIIRRLDGLTLQHKSIIDHQKISQLLKGIFLRCNVLDDIWNRIRTILPSA